jgi:hypothetical protein
MRGYVWDPRRAAPHNLYARSHAWGAVTGARSVPTLNVSW